MNALYRPGPMDYIPSFIARKHGKEEIKYDIPVMERYLKDTYGITVYQEQVMLLSRLLANFTRGESDALRKAMGKKLIEKMNHLKSKFMAGGEVNGFQQEPCDLLFLGGLSDCISQSQLSFGIYGCRVKPKFVQHLRYYKIHGRMQGHAHPSIGAGCQ